MKFSWKLVQHFIEVNTNEFEDIQNQLNMSGIEVESINYRDDDIILDVSVTANRKEIDSALGLARELNIILDKKMFIEPISFVINKCRIHSDRKVKSNMFNYVRIHKIKITDYNSTPNWILDLLEIHNIKPQSIIENIQKYVKIKWGKTFYIIQHEKKKEISIPKELNDHKNFIVTTINNKIFFKQILNSKKEIIIVFADEKYMRINRSNYYKNYDFDENYYIDSLTIIKSFINQSIGKFYEYYSPYRILNSKIKLKQQNINKILGHVEKNTFKYINKGAIEEILKKLKFNNKYIKNKKLFLVEGPAYRRHDLIREIDIIEEISKIHGFKNFYGKCIYGSKQGKQSREFIELKKIKKTLRNLGFNEVINCSLTNNKNYSIKIHNPLNEEQKYLRDNITENLLRNYEYNLKYSSNNLLIFEVGTIFKQGVKPEEKRLLGGLIYANNYNRKDWQKKPENITRFQAKGILEAFLKKIEANVKLENIEGDITSRYGQKSAKARNVIGIYNEKDNVIIGTIKKLNYKYGIKSKRKEEEIYTFEIKLNQLIKTMKNRKHLEYIKKPYSEYPSIIRDLSIQVRKNGYVNKIIENIYKNKNKLVESIEIFNEYNKMTLDRSQQERFVGVRITYRSLHKTLNSNDIKNIDQEINEIINKTKNM
uniref:phenylalanine--tRNA ligase n=1 Tax=Polysiphonia sertularioides TaxID=945028 RepID=A0A1Z1M9C8_9FLOR|nr:Phenylalanine-tRNA ligase beta subunit [Polysiphonia sertularioides]ARW62579.1 Phenylalanine-tRNA ligase beta subunit [Polysiphonia sertularioides]